MNSALEAVLTAVLIGAIGIPSPTRAAVTAVMLTNATAPWARALGFAIGSTLVFGAVALIGLLGVEAPGLEGASPTVNTILGLVMIGAAVAMLVVRRRRMRDPDPQPTSHPMLKATGIGAGVAVQSFGRLLVLLAGGYRIGVVTDLFVVGLATTALMITVWQAPVWGPMALYVFNRPEFDKLQRRASPALDRIEGGVWGAVIVGVVGTWMLFLGVTG